MSEAPEVEVVVSTVRGASASGTKLACILFCASQGPMLPTMVATTNQVLDVYGEGEGPELLAMYVQKTGLPVLALRVASSTPGAVTHIDEIDLGGSSAFTVTGTPRDRYEGIVEVLTGGTLGVDGITFRYSLDAGRTWKIVALGTALTYAMPGTGATLNFAAGNLTATGIARFWTTGPAPLAADITAAYQTMRESKFLVRVFAAGFSLNASLAAELQTQIAEYFSLHKRDSQVVASARDWYADARMQGSAVSVTFEADDETATRLTGSWIADGFKVGMRVAVTSPLNTGVRTVIAVTATVLTFDATPSVVDETTTAATFVGTESVVAWSTAIDAEYAAITGYRCEITAGMMISPTSPLSKRQHRRPVMWAYLIRAMSYDVQISPAKVANGAIVGWELADLGGMIVEYDERTEGILLAKRFVVATTVDNEEGAFICLPRTRHPEDIDVFSASMNVAVMNKGNQIARKALGKMLSREVDLNADGTPTSVEADAIDSYVENQIAGGLLTRGPDGTNASAVKFAMDRTVDLRPQGALVPGSVTYLFKGYIVKIKLTASASTPAQG